MFDYNKFITSQIEGVNSDLTVAGTLFLIVCSTFAFIIPTFVGLWNDYVVKELGYVSIWDKPEIVGFATQYYNTLWFFVLALGVWCLLNWVQMFCLFIDLSVRRDEHV